MSDSASFETLAKALCAALPSSLQSLEKDIQNQFKSILQAAFSRMDLVTREEFDVQLKVLARTREKVEALQGTLERLIEAQKTTKLGE